MDRIYYSIQQSRGDYQLSRYARRVDDTFSEDYRRVAESMARKSRLEIVVLCEAGEVAIDNESYTKQYYLLLGRPLHHWEWEPVAEIWFIVDPRE